MYDLIVIGGGINGAAIACDAAGRGLSVLLVERDDLANHTSSASSKLIHGGLRYLEHFEFKLVKSALQEREILLNKAPHLVWPMPFVMPHKRSIRPAWMIRIGLFLYDHLAGRQKLTGSSGIDLTTHPAGQTLKPQFKKGFLYSDCWGDDARLVVLNAQHAEEHGATIRTRTECLSASRDQNHWQVTLNNTQTQEHETVQAKVLINAAGPWVDTLLSQCTEGSTTAHIVHIKGSHIVVPKIHSQHYAYLLQNDDQRVLFVIPYLDDYSLIGTTDVRYQDRLDDIEISEDEIAYLCEGVNRYFAKSIQSSDIIWSYAGVRPLKCENKAAPSTISREYELELNQDHNMAPILSVFGGKITTHRCLAEDVMKTIQPFFPNMGPKWTQNTPLPGGDIPNADVDHYLTELKKSHPNLEEKILHRYARQYGTRCKNLLHCVDTTKDLGTHFGAGLYQKELEYLVENEFVQTAEDLLWRRTKLGIHFPKNHLSELDEAILTHVAKFKKSTPRKKNQ